MTAPRKCEVCGSTRSEPVYQVEGFSIVRCSQCRLVYVLNPPAPDATGDLYDDAYWEGTDVPGYGGYEAREASKRLHARSLLALVETHAPRVGRLLEVGCAYGYFLDEARRLGWEVQGLEPSPPAARFARDRMGLPVTEERLEDFARGWGDDPAGKPSVGYDAVVLWDVIEHLPEPRTTLQAARELLRPGGILALSTGDVDSFASRIHGKDWSLITPPWHLFYFSRRTLSTLLEGVGFQVEWVGGDGVVAADPSAKRRHLPPFVERLLLSRAVVAGMRKLGAGQICFMVARRPELE
ncbi:MAG: class I SAM-dependent methyltransferase [Gemmatimonadota bacterium]